MTPSDSASDPRIPVSFYRDEVIITFMEQVVWSIIESSAISGEICVADLSDDEVINSAISNFHGTPQGDYIANEGEGPEREWEGEASEMNFGSRHDHELLEEGDRFLGQGKHELAILLYATWIEHWINRIILVRSIGFGTPPELATVLIRSSRLELKIGKVWSSLDLDRFDKDLARAISRVMESRNGFVHFKWGGNSESIHDDQVKRQGVLAAEAKKTVEMLVELEDRTFFAGRTADIQAAFRRNYAKMVGGDGGA
ncbi:hypothetical protein [Kitasatospora herbaricolor]|uniref:hypothetical protein n=1 Tax=Kitasatospora herbaricolor TaxID=68217 RepID=UPI0036DF3181